MLARRTAWTALIYTIDNDPTFENERASIETEPNLTVVLRLQVRAPTTGLDGFSKAEWQRNSAAGDPDQWKYVLGTGSAAPDDPDDTAGYSGTYSTSTGKATYTIDNMDLDDFMLYRFYMEGGETDPAASVPVEVINVSGWGS